MKGKGLVVSHHFHSPIGWLRLESDGKSLTGLYMVDEVPCGSDKHPCGGAFSVFREVESQLGEYFSGKRFEFDVPLSMEGAEFQKRVWLALLEIPYGQTRSYGEIARQLGSPDSARAVGLANASNPVSIIVPCHRVIGANGMLVGYGGGLARKEFLLKHEGTFHPVTDNLFSG